MKNLVLSDVTNITIVFMVVGDVVKKKKCMVVWSTSCTQPFQSHLVRLPQNPTHKPWPLNSLASAAFLIFSHLFSYF